MRYSTEPRFRKYVKENGFLSFARKFDDKYGKTLMDTAKKTGTDAAKIASKRAVKKKLYLNFMAPFYYGCGSTASRLQPLRGGSLLFTIQFPEISGAHFIDLGRMKD